MTCLSEDTRTQRRISKQIEQQLESDKESIKREFTLLLLGASESGKSTFMKQMRIIHGDGYPESERRRFIQPIFQHIFIAIQTLIRAMDKLQVAYDNPPNDTMVKSLLSMEIESVTTFKEPYIDLLRSLWADEGVQDVYDRRREFELIDNAG